VIGYSGACRRHSFPWNHNTMAEVLEREKLLERRETGILTLKEQGRLRHLMQRAILPPED